MKIEKTATSPEVSLEPGYLKFSGKSMMENAIDFYGDIHNWVNNYLASHPQEIVVEFDFVYFNSTSAKQILKLLMNLDESDLKTDIIWQYPKGHDILKLRGVELESMLDCEFRYVEK